MSEYCILIDLLPVSVEIGGRSFPINSDFRVGILLEQLFADKSYPQQEKLAMAINLYFTEAVPDDLQEALGQIQWFYSAGKENFSARENEDPNRRRIKHMPARILDYEIDAPLIYAAFLTQYGIDLQDIEDLHWWKFHAMLSGLKDDLPISRIMLYRGIELETIKDSKLRKQYAALKAKYRLPDALSDQDKVEIAGQIFAPKRGLRR